MYRVVSVHYLIGVCQDDNGQNMMLCEGRLFHAETDDVS